MKHFVKLCEKHFSSAKHFTEAKWRLVLSGNKQYSVKYASPQLPITSFVSHDSEDVPGPSSVEEVQDDIPYLLTNPLESVMSQGIQSDNRQPDQALTQLKVDQLSIQFKDTFNLNSLIAEEVQFGIRSKYWLP